MPVEVVLRCKVTYSELKCCFWMNTESSSGDTKWKGSRKSTRFEALISVTVSLISCYAITYMEGLLIHSTNQVSPFCLILNAIFQFMYVFVIANTTVRCSFGLFDLWMEWRPISSMLYNHNFLTATEYWFEKSIRKVLWTHYLSMLYCLR